ncbi:MAG TPA: helix-turn-helix domain-containing protein [Thermoanaerobaculia bacterium]|nr:helix-turn-helix domain-containing protein [Thermoanaerobaculia bacterium]
MTAESKNMSPEVKHMLSVLRSVIRGLGYNYQDVANKLGLSNGYMSRLFSGKIELKFQHIVDISRVLGFEVEEIFHLAYPRQKEPTSAAAQRYHMLTQIDAGTPVARFLAPRSTNENDELERRVASALRNLLTSPPPPPQPAVPSPEEMERAMERMLRKLLGQQG